MKHKIRKVGILKIGMAAVALAFALYFVPFPTPIDVTHSGYYVPKNGEKREISVTIRGWELHYLLKDNALNATLQIAGKNAPTPMDITAKFLGQTRTVPPQSPVYYTSWGGYRAATNRTSRGSLYYYGDFEHLAIFEGTDNTCIASQNDFTDPQDVIDHFEPCINLRAD